MTTQLELLFVYCTKKCCLLLRQPAIFFFFMYGVLLLLRDLEEIFSYCVKGDNNTYLMHVLCG